MNVTLGVRLSAERTPDAVAIILPDHRLVSYATLDRLIDATVVRLAEAGVSRDDTVALAVQGPDEFRGLVTVLAMARCGIASADPAWPGRPTSVLIDEGGGFAAQQAFTRSIPIDSLWSNLTAPSSPGPIAEDGDATFRIMASSGSTGRPKASIVTHALSLARLASAAQDSDRHGPVRVIARGLGAEGGLRSVLRALHTGATIVLTNPAHLSAAISRHGVTGLITSPISLRAWLADLNGPPPRSLRLIEVTGAPFPLALRHKALAALPDVRLMVGAGCMECGRLGSGDPGEDPVPAMALKPGVDAVARDASGEDLPAGEVGSLYYRAAGMVSGYLDNPESSERHFVDGWFASGDLGSVSADRMLRLVGRSSEVINSGGVKIAPAAIEEVLLLIPGVTGCAAFGVPDASGVDLIWVAFTADRPIPSSEIAEACRLPLGQATPRHILQVPKLPYTQGGKVNRQVLIDYAKSLDIKGTSEGL